MEMLYIHCMNTLTLAYTLARKSGKFEPKRVERAHNLLLDKRTAILPTHEIDFPSDTEGFRVLPLADETGHIRICDCPDRRKTRTYCKHDIARFLLWRAAHLRHTGRILIA